MDVIRLQHLMNNVTWGTTSIWPNYIWHWHLSLNLCHQHRKLLHTTWRTIWLSSAVSWKGFRCHRMGLEGNRESPLSCHDNKSFCTRYTTKSDILQVQNRMWGKLWMQEDWYEMQYPLQFLFGTNMQQHMTGVGWRGTNGMFGRKCNKWQRRVERAWRGLY